MTKTNKMSKKVFALSLGTLMLGSIAAGTLMGANLFSATVFADEDPNKLVLETVDEFATHGYKIEKATAANSSQQNPYDDATNPYDYIITVVDKSSSWWNPRDGKVMFEENSHEAVWNITTQSGKSVFGGNFNYKNCTKRTSTDESISAWKYNDSEKVMIPDTGERAAGEGYGDWKCGETVMRFNFRERDGSCPSHGDVPCTCHVDGEGEGESLDGMYLSVLYRVVHIEDVNFLFTGAVKDVNEHEGGMWLNYGMNNVLGVSTADESWTHAERYDFINTMKDFFQNIYYLENIDLATATAPTAAELEGRDFYSLMTGDNLVANGLILQTEVRPDHIEIYKKIRQYVVDNEDGTQTIDWAGAEIAFETGDAIYLAEGLKMIGKDGNNNWTYASEGGQMNLLPRSQMFVYTEDGWTIDQYTVGISLDVRNTMVELGGTGYTLTATVSEGKFASSGDTSVTWSSSDEEIATVDQNGHITAVAAGTATITASLVDGTSASCNVTVVVADQIDSVTLNKRNVTLYTSGDKTSEKLIATVSGGSQADTNVTWTSSNEAVATVDQDGNVTAVAQGKATITATASDGTHSASATVNVFLGTTTEPGDDPTTPGDSGNTPATPGDSNTNNGDNDDGKTGGCGSAIYGAAAGLGAMVIAAGVILVLRKKNNG